MNSFDFGVSVIEVLNPGGYMKVAKIFFTAGTAAIVVFATPALADTEKFQISGSARVRAEFKDNADFNDTTGDYSDFIGSRFRLGLKVNATSKTSIFLEPQFQKVWGEAEYVPSSATGNTSTNTSGATNDTPLDVHQGYLSYAVNEPLSIIVGRRELIYGDELLVGGVGWSNIGRSFDLIQGVYKHERGSVEIFDATVADRNTSSAGPGDKMLSGIYSSNKIADWMQSADAYVFYNKDAGATPVATTAAYGVRLKSPVGPFDYRAEATFENVKAASSTGERQIDVELGYLIYEPMKVRIAAEYFSATENFDALYPTGHKWLGYADNFGRRNIQGYHARLSIQPTEKVTTTLDYHSFERDSTSSPAYKLNGTTGYGATGDASAIADEIDLVVKYKFDEDLTVETGAARTSPGEYLKQNAGDDISTFYYFQVSTAF